MKNNFKELEEPIEVPLELKKGIKDGVRSRIGFIKFLSDVVDLYIGKVGNVVTGLVTSFEVDEEEESEHAPDNDGVPPTEGRKD